MDTKPTPTELLNAWRDAVRAADLAERMTAAAADAADHADRGAVISAEVAQLADQAAAAASRAAEQANVAAALAANFAKNLREQALPDAEQIVATTRKIEVGAGEAFHHAEDEARRQEDEAP